MHHFRLRTNLRNITIRVTSDDPIDYALEATTDELAMKFLRSCADIEVIEEPKAAEVSGKVVRDNIAVLRAKETARQLYALVKWLDESGQPNAARRAHEIAMGAEKLLEELGAEL